MSERKRRQCRVQGGWATAGKAQGSTKRPAASQVACSIAQSPLEEKCNQPRGATLGDGKHFQFQDPKTVRGFYQRYFMKMYMIKG